MKSTWILITAWLLVSAWSCNESKKTAPAEESDPAGEVKEPVGGPGSSRGMAVTADTTRPEQPAKQDTYRLVVSFVSHGEGTDGEAIATFDGYIRNLKKKVSFEMYNWGREGEVDYCINPGELSADEQKEFVQKTKDLLKACKLVNIYENDLCRYKK